MLKMDEYKHPQWQKKRLEALDAHGFRCQKCMSEKKTLHVHHKRYPKGKKIWECKISDLSVLCEDCHKDVEDFVLFAREHGTEVLLIIEDVLGLGKPKDLIQIFIDYNSRDLNPEAKAAFSIAIRAIDDAIAYQSGKGID